MGQKLLAAAVMVALSSSGLVAESAAADASTVSLSGTIDAPGTITAYADPADLEWPSGLDVLATASVDVGAFVLTVPSGSAVLIEIAPTDPTRVVTWIGAQGSIAGAYPLVRSIAASTDIELGALAAVASGSVRATFAEPTDLACLAGVGGGASTCSVESIAGPGSEMAAPTRRHLITGLYPGTYVLSGGENAGAYRPTVVVRPGLVTTVDVASQGGTLRGRVIDENGRGLAGQQVVAGASTSTTDAAGRYTLRQLAAGTARLTVGTPSGGNHYDERRGWAVRGAGYDENEIVVRGVVPGKTVTAAPVTLRRKGLVTATVDVARGRTGTLYAVQGTRVIASIPFSGTDRAVRFAGAPGTYRLYFVVRDGARRYAARKITLHADRVTRLGSIRPTKRTVTLTGTIRSGAADTVALRLGPDPDAGVLASGTAVHGRYIVRGVVPGTYWAESSARGIRAGAAKRLTLASSRSGSVIAGQPAPTRRSWLLTVDGRPVRGASGSGSGSAVRTGSARGLWGVEPGDASGVAVFTSVGAGPFAWTVRTLAFGDHTPYYLETDPYDPASDAAPALRIRG